jgi:hypothetical protein
VTRHQPHRMAPRAAAAVAKPERIWRWSAKALPSARKYH